MHSKTVGKDTENNLFRQILVKLLFFVNRFVLDQYLIFLALMIYSSEPGTAWAPDLLPSVPKLIQFGIAYQYKCSALLVIAIHNTVKASAHPACSVWLLQN